MKKDNILGINYFCLGQQIEFEWAAISIPMILFDSLCFEVLNYLGYQVT